MTKEEFKKQLSKKLQQSQFDLTDDYEFYEISDDTHTAKYTPDLTIIKGGEVIAVCKVLNKKDEEDKRVAELWSNCNEAWYFITICNDVINVRQYPYCHNIEPKNPFALQNITPFILDVKPEEMNIDELADTLGNFDRKEKTTILMAEFFEEVKKIASKYNVEDKVENFIEKIKKNNISEILEFTPDKVWMHRNYESLFMFNLLGTVKSGEKLNRYTTDGTLQRILEEKTHSLCSLISMNDPSEVDYADKYMASKEMTLPNEFSFAGDGIYTYIVSLCEKELNDDLTMWRLYGDDSKGVALEFTVPDKFDTDYFQIAKVDYADEKGKHNLLDFFIDVMNIKLKKRSFYFKDWNVWKHFFKPYEYQIEKEVRIVCFLDEFAENNRNINKKWVRSGSGIHSPLITVPLKSDNSNAVQFPLNITGIKLGCNYPNKQTNALYLTRKAKETGLFDENFKVKISKINNYR